MCVTECQGVSGSVVECSGVQWSAQCTTETPVRGKSMSIRVVNRGESEGGNLRGEQDARRIKGRYRVECLTGCLIEINKTSSENSVYT